ncbi:polysaccharide pyruvyl transferase family protein [Hyphomicrobium sp.]|uniref:polysaccharide pyruvyl transferase family protein n=1 Tax=Hyphomicrobium sp. TaxID=82 RepID=UPI0025C40B90|nr:polysaccharide pyruvyl transferase family protein [Hyphomicrobium sp.]
MRKVGVICAFNPGNTGMFSVDLAASQLFDAWNIDYTLINFQKRPWRLPSKYLVCRNIDKLGRFSHLLYWGDFQNNPVYGTRDFASREMKFGNARTVDMAVSNWARLHLDLPDLLGKHARVASIGNCFLGAHEAAAQYALGPSLARFADTAFRILPRETYSVNEITSASSSTSPPNISTGIDPAFLLEPKEYHDFRDAHYFGYHFARSDVRDISEGLKAIEARTSLVPLEVSWAVGNRKAKQKNLFYSALATMKKCRFVVTDVYHLAVNTLNHGTPVVLVSRKSSATKSSVDDQKKYALAEQLGARPLHLPLAEDASLASQAGKIIETYESLMDDQISFREVMGGLRKQKDRFRSSIKEIVEA